MGLIKRLHNIVSANLHDLLDRCENPELLLHQAIRNMEASLRTALAGAAKVVAHEHVIARQRGDTESEAKIWRRQAESAARAGDDIAARHALHRQHNLQRLAEALAAEHREAAAASRTLRRQLDALRLRLAEAQRQRDLLIARSRAAEARRHLLRAATDFPVDTDGVHEFDRLARSVLQSEAETGALADLLGATVLDAADPNAREADAWVEQELQSLKSNS